MVDTILRRVSLAEQSDRTLTKLADHVGFIKQILDEDEAVHAAEALLARDFPLNVRRDQSVLGADRPSVRDSPDAALPQGSAARGCRAGIVPPFLGKDPSM